jgi:hypothetical protein
MPACYADLVRKYDRQGRHDDAIALHERAIEHGWRTISDPRSDIAEFHLRAVNQLSDVRRYSLRSLGRELDELEQRVDPFMAQWSSEEQAQKRRLARLIEAGNFRLPTPDRERERVEVVVSLAWFPSGEYEEAVKRWPPGRNEPCWCSSGRKYKKCCGPAPARPMHDPKP